MGEEDTKPEPDDDFLDIYPHRMYLRDVLFGAIIGMFFGYVFHEMFGERISSTPETASFNGIPGWLPDSS